MPPQTERIRTRSVVHDQTTPTVRPQPPDSRKAVVRWFPWLYGLFLQPEQIRAYGRTCADSVLFVPRLFVGRATGRHCTVEGRRAVNRYGGPFNLRAARFQNHAPRITREKTNFQGKKKFVALYVRVRPFSSLSCGCTPTLTPLFLVCCALIFGPFNPSTIGVRWACTLYLYPVRAS